MTALPISRSGPFSIERQALFALSVATQTGDPDDALRAADMADRAWAAGAPIAPAIWAQIRVGTGVAHLLKGDLEGTAEQLTEMLTLDPGMRLATVTRYLVDLNRRLNRPRFQDSPLAAQLKQQIHDFNAAALPTTSTWRVHESSARAHDQSLAAPRGT